MSRICSLCCRDALEPAYWQDGSHAAVVHICSHCGFAQRCGVGRRKNAAAGNGAKDPGVAVIRRTGKSAEDRNAGGALALLGTYCDLTRPLTVLDIGAARGTFVRKFLNAAPRASTIAIEPDAHRAWVCANLNRSKVIAKPIEQVGLPDARFDIVHIRHTLEHLASPLAVLVDLWRTLKQDGLLIVACRNIDAIRDEAIAEEWFKPTRRNFYSPNTLSRLLRAAGFEIVDAAGSCERENILLVAKKCNFTMRNLLADPLEVHATRALISIYSSARQRNLLALNAIVAELNTLSERGLAICGSGRLFDSLVQYAGLDEESFRHFSEAQLGVDSSQCIESLKRDGPDSGDTIPGVIVVMSDTHADKIADIASRCTPHTRIIHYSELVFRAYKRLAA